MYKHNLVLKKNKRLLSHSLSSSRIYWLKVTATFGIGHCSKFHAASCHCLASCNCSGSAHCCHDPIIVRTASTFPWFHSVCASVSMFTINVDNCLFLSLFLLLFHYLRVYLGVFSEKTYRGCSLSPDPSQTSSAFML